MARKRRPWKSAGPWIGFAVGEVEEAAFLDHRQQLGAGALAEGLAGGLPVAAAVEEAWAAAASLNMKGVALT